MLADNAISFSSNPSALATLDYMTLKETDLDATVSWTVDQASQGHGLVLWFDSILDGGSYADQPAGRAPAYLPAIILSLA